ncbi:MAG: hypothetical protein A2V66_03990 [Ignavibacteria bacterium RBG_13_36_8]|nr:MAG: hypothetical protein A2V66_03990 [Ignavibacteria bacterium RBG_13_36_8]
MKGQKELNMEYTVDYLMDKKIVSVKMKGRLNFQVAEQYSREAVKLARQNDCTKFLIDHTETTMQGGVNKIHSTGEEMQQFGFKNTDRIAIVIANLGNDSNLLEPVNQNSQCCVLKYFCADNTQEALNWLSRIE